MDFTNWYGHRKNHWEYIHRNCFQRQATFP